MSESIDFSRAMYEQRLTTDRCEVCGEVFDKRNDEHTKCDECSLTAGCGGR
jgi:hypothetical protein